MAPDSVVVVLDTAETRWDIMITAFPGSLLYIANITFCGYVLSVLCFLPFLAWSKPLPYAHSRMKSSQVYAGIYILHAFTFSHECTLPYLLVSLQ